MTVAAAEGKRIMAGGRVLRKTKSSLIAPVLFLSYRLISVCVPRPCTPTPSMSWSWTRNCAVTCVFLD
jgi:hypothetical protein